jgi:hypothetical protein
MIQKLKRKRGQNQDVLERERRRIRAVQKIRLRMGIFVLRAGMLMIPEFIRIELYILSKK